MSRSTSTVFFSKSALIEKGREAAKAVGGEFVAPGFTEAEKAKGMTDFNDLARSRGKEGLRGVLAPALGLEPGREAEREREAGGMEM